MIVYTLVTKKEVNNIFEQDGKFPNKFYYFLDNAFYALKKGKEKEDGEFMLLVFDLPIDILKKSMRFEMLQFNNKELYPEIVGTTKMSESQFYFPTFEINEDNLISAGLLGAFLGKKICAKVKEKKDEIFAYYYLNKSSYQHYLKDMSDYIKCCDEQTILMFLENNKDLFFTGDILQLKKS